MSVRNVYNSLTLLLPHADDSMGQIYADYDAVIHKSKKILHQVTHELIPAAGYFTQDSLDTFLALIPIAYDQRFLDLKPFFINGPVRKERIVSGMARGVFIDDR